MIWDLNHGACRDGMLEGHDAAVLTCAWSPDGNTIATGSEDGTARLWDAHTFLQREVLQLKGSVACLAFSTNGVWLACGSNRGECYIVNVTSGTLHMSLCDSPHGWRGPIRTPVLAFDPTGGSTRLAAAPSLGSDGVKVVDVKTGNILAQMGGEIGRMLVVQDVSFSSDGKLVLGVSATFRNAVKVYVWEASTGIELVRLTQDRYDPPAGCGIHRVSSRFVPRSCADPRFRLQSIYFVSKFDLPPLSRSMGYYYRIGNDAVALGCYYQQVCIVKGINRNAFGRGSRYSAK